MLHDFANIFQEENDNGKKRTKPTPAITHIKAGLETFKNKWKEYVKVHLKQDAAEKLDTALQNLIKHIERGCLSGIPVGGGTNRNERFHRCLNNHGILKQPKLGVALGRATLLNAVQKRNYEIEHDTSTNWLCSSLVHRCTSPQEEKGK